MGINPLHFMASLNFADLNTVMFITFFKYSATESIELLAFPCFFTDFLSVYVMAFCKHFLKEVRPFDWGNALSTWQYFCFPVFVKVI